MARSLSFVYLFVILAISYIGGALLFREWPVTSLEQIIGLYDQRVVKGSEAALWSPVVVTLSFILLAIILSKYKRVRFITMFLGAIKCAFFGLSSTYLLSTGLKLVSYTIWWFPFQLISCLLFLILCSVLNPPFFAPPASKKNRPLTAVPPLIALLLITQILELAIFHFIK
ncbi:hypothetical protein CSV71_00685 [Sporosarcina sp. P21c]|uniref:hypothetical protein n=1 Tax=Sporosarcina TaxID=1569 RepID=UPI000A148E68|nr:MULTISPECIES: hypothetical protein [Sporosarcina]ARJ40148.1 hypothetical protein SporoP8_15390 [Sporosarcina ureae]PIC68653.1 hypothetical protein CSV78_00895 [Sporosarcina sp. P16a]PIC84573.1 hypothetical protein CSV73_01365 [Sporosarcina sp. P1]PIC91161.1 hypothetical protein CSV71_00685 [Sporosarcina sp. P21c]PIC93706.1 hypothetical protein CSV70_04235 [Sporosarcina sp. P25]